jgi:hypothetical protein
MWLCCRGGQQLRGEVKPWWDDRTEAPLICTREAREYMAR